MLIDNNPSTVGGRQLAPNFRWKFNHACDFN